MLDSSGVKRHYSTGDMLNEKDDFDTRRPKSEGFNQSLYRLNQVGRKRYSFGVSVYITLPLKILFHHLGVLCEYCGETGILPL